MISFGSINLPIPTNTCWVDGGIAIQLRNLSAAQKDALSGFFKNDVKGTKETWCYTDDSGVMRQVRFVDVALVFVRYGDDRWDVDLRLQDKHGCYEEMLTDATTAFASTFDLIEEFYRLRDVAWEVKQLEAADIFDKTATDLGKVLAREDKVEIERLAEIRCPKCDAVTGLGLDDIVYRSDKIICPSCGRVIKDRYGPTS